MKAFQHAETYFNLLVSIPGDKIKLTPLDAVLYVGFRNAFPDMNIMSLDEVRDFKCEEAKAKWRAFIAHLLTVVPRIQFLCVEVARNREGCNASIYKNQKMQKAVEEAYDPSIEQEMAELQAKIVAQLE
ncbi:polysaccharide biosynthesis domain containing protein 1 [Kappamyces sp. JEL0680]|nr:polysaccharide biosynthesis domain containing protein 1 [Kappamyces sp. JEL0680]